MQAIFLMSAAAFNDVGGKFSTLLRRLEVQGSRFEVQGLRFKVQGSRFEVQGSGCGVLCSRGEVPGLSIEPQTLNPAPQTSNLER